MNGWKRACGAMLAAVLSLTAPVQAPPAQAQDYPTRPVTITVCFPPGASTDTIARRIAERLTTSLGRPVVVDNRGGAGGNIAGSLLTRPSLPVQTLQEFLAYARARPGQLNFASIGVGSSFHLGLEQINAAAGVAMTHIPFRGGGQAVPELLAGRLDAMFASWSLAKPHVQAGSVRPLAIAGEERYAELPDVPTLTEAGLPDIWVQEGLGFFAPGGTPAPIIARLNSEITRIIGEPVLRDWLIAQGVPPSPKSPEAFRAQLQAGVSTIEALIRRIDLKLD